MGKSLATRNEPDVVRLSSQGELLNERQLVIFMNRQGRGEQPTSEHDDLDALLGQPFASVPPPAPERGTTTSSSS